MHDGAGKLIASAVLLAATLAGTDPAAQQPSAPSAPPTINVQALGPQVGERVPDFALRDQNGVLRTLPSIAGPKGAILVFFRSADW
jgi:hypothetical protein